MACRQKKQYYQRNLSIYVLDVICQSLFITNITKSVGELVYGGFPILFVLLCMVFCYIQTSNIYGFEALFIYVCIHCKFYTNELFKFMHLSNFRVIGLNEKSWKVDILKSFVFLLEIFYQQFCLFLSFFNKLKLSNLLIPAYELISFGTFMYVRVFLSVNILFINKVQHTLLKNSLGWQAQTLF